MLVSLFKNTYSPFSLFFFFKVWPTCSQFRGQYAFFQAPKITQVEVRAKSAGRMVGRGGGGSVQTERRGSGDNCHGSWTRARKSKGE